MQTIKLSRSSQSGFSLLEILVAFSILAIALGVLLNIFSSGVETAAVAEEYTSAVQIAETLMARTGVESPLQQGQNDGIENDKYRWSVTIAPYELVLDDLDAGSLPATLFMVTVRVGWESGNAADGDHQREVELTTLKLSPKTTS
ncbi:MAG: prepilin-type N-terminal cleavage/methylation domain-containing protein [Methylosarcina sp.]